MAQSCLIIVMALENRKMSYDSSKYHLARNWSYVLLDDSAVERFDYVDMLYSNTDSEYNRERILELQKHIEKMHEYNIKERKYKDMD